MTDDTTNDLINAISNIASRSEERGSSPILPIHPLNAQALEAQNVLSPRPIRYRVHRDDPATSIATPQQSSPIGSPHPETNSTTSKLTIVDRSTLTTLREHNGILRSHNLSLATQNKNLRKDGIELTDIVKQCEPAQREIEQLRGDLQALYEENEILKQEKEVLEECGVEWARRESIVLPQAQGWKARCEKLMAVVTVLKAEKAELEKERDEQAQKVEELELLVDQLSTTVQQQQEDEEDDEEGEEDVEGEDELFAEPSGTTEE